MQRLLQLLMVANSPLLSEAQCGPGLGNACLLPNLELEKCESNQGVCKTYSGCLDRSECRDEFGERNPLDEVVGFDKCECNFTADTHGCGEPGGECTGEFGKGCSSAVGICKTHSGCTNRTDIESCPESVEEFDTQDLNWKFDKCVCGKEARGSYVLVLVASAIGLIAFVVAFWYFPGPGFSYCSTILVLGAVGATSIWSFALLLVEAGLDEEDDFLSHTGFMIALAMLSAFTFVSVLGIFKMGRVWIPTMVIVYCVVAGFFAFTFSMMAICFGFVVIFLLVSASVQASKLTGAWEGPASDSGGDGGGYGCGVIGKIVLSLAGFPGRFVNFVLQVSLVSYAFGEVHAFDEVHKVKTLIRVYLKLLFGTLVDGLPGLGSLMEVASEISTQMNDWADNFSTFMVDYSSIWTPNKDTGYVSVGVFEIAVIAAVLLIVLSDVLLIVAPRENAGTIGKLAADFVSRSLLYVLQVLAAASHVLVFALINGVDRPDAQGHSQKFLYDISSTMAEPLTVIYVGLTLVSGAYILFKLWSGADAGLQDCSVWLMHKNCVFIDPVQANAAFPGAFILGFFGIWPQFVLDAFEIPQRTDSYKLEENDVILATVNALSYPLYVLPFGTFVAKLGEYLNQNPIYTTTRGFNVFELGISLTFVAEYLLVLVVAKDTIDAVGTGIPEHDEIKDVAEENGESLQTVVLVLLAITVLRTCISTCRDCWQGRQKQSSVG